MKWWNLMNNSITLSSSQSISSVLWCLLNSFMWLNEGTNIPWIRNCSTYSELVTVHALELLAGSRRTLLHRVPRVRFVCHHQMAALFWLKRRHGRQLEGGTSNQKSDSVNGWMDVHLAYLKISKNPIKFHPDPIWNDGAIETKKK